MAMQKITGKKARRTIKSAIESGMLNDNPYLPIMRLAADGVVAVITVFQAEFGERLEDWSIPPGKPCLIVIGDDMPAPGTSFGPQRFHQPSIIAALPLCSGTVLQVASFRPDVMAEIAVRLVNGTSVMVVECSESRESEWNTFLLQNKAPQLLVVTVDVTKYRKH